MIYYNHFFFSLLQGQYHQQQMQLKKQLLRRLPSDKINYGVFAAMVLMLAAFQFY